MLKKKSKAIQKPLISCFFCNNQKDSYSSNCRFYLQYQNFWIKCKNDTQLEVLSRNLISNFRMSPNVYDLMSV